MKKIALLVLIPMILNIQSAMAAITEVEVSGGTLDRRFDEGRSLYYITPDDYSAVPQVSGHGARVIKAASDFDENRATVLADEETGAEYRFVIKKNTAPQIYENESGVSLNGIMTLKGVFPAPCEIMILKPTTEDKNISYSLSDISEDNRENIIFDFDTLYDKNEYTYNFPSGAQSGMFRVIIGGINVGKSNQAEFECYYASENEMKSVREKINSIQDAAELKRFVIENRLFFKVDKSEMESFSDFSVIAGLVLNKGFSDVTDAADALNEGIAVTRVNRAPLGEIVQTIAENKDVLGVVFDNCYENVKDKTALEALIYPAYCTNAADVQTVLNKASAVQNVNEADFSNIKTRFFDNIDKFGFTDAEKTKINNLSEKQTELMLSKFVNQSYTSPAEFVKSVMSVINGINNAEANSNGNTVHRGGGGGGGGAASVSYTPAPTVKEPDSLIKTTEEEIVFNDIDTVPWAKQAILFLHDSGVINGRDAQTFAPNELITREEFVKIIVTTLGIETEKKDITFSDVDKDTWYYPYVISAAGEGIINGNDDGSFGTGQFITREDMAVIIKKACDYRKIKIEEKYTKVFADEDDVSDYAKAAVRSLFFGGLINGTGDNKVSPKEPATRAMSAQIVYNMMKNF